MSRLETNPVRVTRNVCLLCKNSRLEFNPVRVKRNATSYDFAISLFLSLRVLTLAG